MGAQSYSVSQLAGADSPHLQRSLFFGQLVVLVGAVQHAIGLLRAIRLRRTCGCRRLAQRISHGSRVPDRQLEGNSRLPVVDAREPRGRKKRRDGVARVDVGIARVAFASADKVQAVAEVVQRVFNFDGDGVAYDLLGALLAAHRNLDLWWYGNLELLLYLHLVAPHAVAQEVVLLDGLLAVQPQVVVLIVVFERNVSAQQTHAGRLELAAAEVDFLELGRLRLDGDGRLALDEARAEAEVELQTLALDGEGAGERRVVVDFHGDGRRAGGPASVL